MSVFQMKMREASKRTFDEKLSRFGVGCTVDVEQHLACRTGFRTAESSRTRFAGFLIDRKISCASPHPTLKFACR